jgi:ATP-dependent Clp protease adaptor protein ClpS
VQPMSEHDYAQDELVLAEDETKLEKPSLYKVLIHNDNFTTMDFVVYVLNTIFQHTETEAITIMLNVHIQGVGVAGIYPFEIAEMKVAKVTSLAQANEFPLLCTLEEV